MVRIPDNGILDPHMPFCPEITWILDTSLISVERYNWNICSSLTVCQQIPEIMSPLLAFFLSRNILVLSVNQNFLSFHKAPKFYFACEVMQANNVFV